MMELQAYQNPYLNVFFLFACFLFVFLNHNGFVIIQVKQTSAQRQQLLSIFQ